MPIPPLLLHTVWTGAVFNVWIERTGQPRTQPLRVRGNTIIPHPHALGGRSLDEARKFFSARMLPETFFHRRVPSDSFGPLPSHEAVPPDAKLVMVRVPALRVEVTDALPLLLGLPPSFPAAPDTRAWQAAVDWVLGLVERNRIVPVLMCSGGLASASWDISLDRPADVERLDALEQAMPPAALLEQEMGRRALLSFARMAVRRLAQDAAMDAEPSVAMPATWPKAAVRWTQALLDGTAQISGPRRALQTLDEDVQEWTRPLREGPRPTLRFRLDPTIHEGRWQVEIQVTLAAGDGAWFLRVSACRDPRCLEATPWAPFAAELASQLDTLLARAAEAFPAVAVKGDVIDLDDATAAAFIVEYAPRLQEQGFPVFIPAGLPTRPDAVRLDLQVEGLEGGGELGREALLRFGWQISVDGQSLDMDVLLAAAEDERQVVRCGERWIMLRPGQAREIAALLRARTSGSLGDALHIAATAEEGQVSLHLEGTLERLGEDAALQPVEAPASLQGTLRPYQARGLSWLVFMRELGVGVCLADDMGLGKTIQVISLLLRDQEQGREGPVLLVCPTSVVGNWRREITRFGPTLRVMVHHGGTRERDDGFAHAAASVDVVLTTYGLVHRDSLDLAAVAWRGVVLDEAQNIKNAQTAQARAVRTLHAGFRLALTGTPVENRLTDLWSIMDFLNPGLLGSATAFHRRFTVPIQKDGDTECLQRLRRAVAPLLLRRSKSDPTVITDLPEKQEMKVYCPLTAEQATLYRNVTAALLERVDDADGMRRRSSILAALTRLKQVCNHPACLPGIEGALPGRSGKLARLEEMLEEVVAEGERALVFTQFAEWGGQMVPYLAERLECEVLWLHGGTMRTERDAMVERFATMTEPAVFVLSLRAGGTGLNLVSANHVFHFDRWWNPAVENQATDRAFRIGQTRNVQVHKFVCDGTLEESIDRLIESKTDLAEGVLGTGESWLTELSTADLRDLVELRGELMECET